VSQVLLDVQLPNDPDVVAFGRHHLARAVEAERLEITDDASLIVSELLANAVEHAEGEIRLRATRTDHLLRVEVHDRGSGRPEVRHGALDDEYGRGLLIIERIAARWGVEPSPVGKLVWAELIC
jgi:anti-sigma regulatory factor (Ser/Thr protein kinase)